MCPSNLDNDGHQKTEMCLFFALLWWQFPVVRCSRTQSHLPTLHRSRWGQKPRFAVGISMTYDICHTFARFADISTSGFSGHIGISGRQSSSKSLHLNSPWSILQGLPSKKRIHRLSVKMCGGFFTPSATVRSCVKYIRTTIYGLMFPNQSKI